MITYLPCHCIGGLEQYRHIESHVQTDTRSYIRRRDISDGM